MTGDAAVDRMWRGGGAKQSCGEIEIVETTIDEALPLIENERVADGQR